MRGSDGREGEGGDRERERERRERRERRGRGSERRGRGMRRAQWHQMNGEIARAMVGRERGVNVEGSERAVWDAARDQASDPTFAFVVDSRTATFL